MSIRIPTVLSLFAAITFVSQADGQDVLRWKFQRGEQLNYQVQQNMKTVIVVGNNEINNSMKQSMDMVWDVLDVAAGGDAIMHQTVQRIQMEMASGTGEPVGFDTSNPEMSEDRSINAMGDVFRKIVNQDFKVSMKPSGEIGKVEIPAELLQAIQASGAGSAAALNEDTLKQMMKQSAVMLPEKGVSPDSTWTSQQNVELPFGTMMIKSTMTFLKKDAEGNAIIGIVPEISVTPKEGAPVKMTLTSSEGTGQVTFSIARGRVTKSQLDLKMEMEIDSGQQVFNQTIRQHTALTLIP